VSQFIHLHVHSDYSLLRSTITVEALAKWANAHNMSAIALTDEGNLFAVPSFLKACKKFNVRPIIGCEFILAPEGRTVHQSSASRRIHNTIVLLAESQQGYQNLSMLSSLAYKEGFYYHPRIDDQLLEQYHKGLIFLSGSVRSEIPKFILENKYENLHMRLSYYKELFGCKSVFLELNDHKTTLCNVLNEKIVHIAKEFNLPCVAANEAYYLNQKDAAYHDILLHVGMNKQKTEHQKVFQNEEFYLKDESKIKQVFSQEMIDTSFEIAQRCVVPFEPISVQLPEYTIPQGFGSAEEYLTHTARKGLKKRYPKASANIEQRLSYELKIIITMGFTGYFLIILDLITYARNHDIPVGPGRGSGASSLVAYVLGITNIDPIKYKLLFERFLNPERISMPDFDIDFCIEGRSSVIKHVMDTYGEDHVGQIITFGTLKARAALKDVGRVLGIPFAEVDKVSKLIPPFMTESIASFIKQSTLLKKEIQKDTIYQEWISAANKLTGLNRHASMHPAGIVIGRLPLHSYVPLYRDPKTRTIATQFSMDYLEQFGLIKMDLLGLKTLTTIKNAETQIRTINPNFHIDTIPEDDQKTFQLLSRGDSLAVFQLESSGYQKILRKVKPEKIADIIALNALYRPGPMQVIDQYIKSKKTPEKIIFPLPELREILEETYGVIVYQEQVMQIVQKIGNFSLGQADIIRKAMGKKDEKEMKRLKSLFIEKSRDNGYSSTQAIKLFDLLEPFAGYGFNKAHATAYAILAYQTAYLKANFPVQFMAANLNNEFQNPDTFSLYLKQIHIMRISLLPPDINHSHARFTAHEDKIYYGFMGIKHINSATSNAIVTARIQHVFKDCVDFLERMDKGTITKKIFEILILSGTFDSLHSQRKILYKNRDKLYAIAQENIHLRQTGQFTLFGQHIDQQIIYQCTRAKENDFSLQEKLKYEKDLLGTYFSGHPLDLYQKAWTKIKHLKTKQAITIIGIYKTVRRHQTGKGKEMLIAEIEDYHNIHEIVIFAQTAIQYADLLQDESVLIITGRRESMSDRIITNTIEKAVQDKNIKTMVVHIKLKNPFNSKKDGNLLRSIILQNKGNCTLQFHLPTDTGTTTIETSPQFSVSPGENLINSAQACPLIERIWIDERIPDNGIAS